MVPSSLIAQLAQAADTEIDRLLTNGPPGMPIPRGEVDFVATVTLGAPAALAAVWRPILNPAGYSVTITGVMCHQTPMVDFHDAGGTLQRCELADLLLVADDGTGTAPPRRVAALVQAKMSKGATTALTAPGDLVQLDLMTRWPPFTLPPAFPTGARDFHTCSHPGTALDCGRYGLIDRQPNPDWLQYPPAQRMGPGGDRLGTFLAQMLEQGQTAWGREATGTADDWSRTVDDLMQVTAGVSFTFKSGYSGQRGNIATAMAIGPPPTGPGAAAGFRDLGISILHIEIKREG